MICNVCKTEYPIENFPFRDRAKNYRRKQCKTCDSASRKTRKQSKKGAEAVRRDKEREKLRRANPTNRPIYIVRDSKLWDRKRGLENNLTVEFATEAIKHGCTYCGETNIKMTLDRLDNNIGHTQANVVCSCYRCNMIRGNMPVGAFEEIAPAIRIAREKGLFEGWTGGCWR